MTSIHRLRFASPTLFVGGTVLAAALGAAACSGSRAATATPADAPTVAVARVERGDLTERLTLAAEFRPFQEVDVHAKVAGYVKAINVDVGDRVRAGQLLAVLEVPEIEDEAQQDQATIQRSSEEIKRAQADLERAESAHDIAHLASTRLAGVLKSRPNLVAQQDIDDAAARDRQAEAQVSTAKAALAAAQQQLAISKASASKTQTLLEYAKITAPFPGVVTRRYADTGSMIQAGTASQTQAMPVVTLSQNDLLRLTIPVPESVVSHIHVGAPVEVRVDAVGRTMPGTVARFANKVSPDTRTMETEVDVPNKDLSLVPGMYAYASIDLDHAQGVLCLPVQAVDRSEDKATVLVVANGTLERRDVSLGIESPDKIEVKHGLQEHDMVVIGSRGQLRPGTKVNAKVEGDAPRRAE
ncbi:MAG TPA: efflux RND transporter periplasmic adaptor subunit [Vicinamibacterales bacterium]|jgi:RND family efflux transporter MFP subunit